MPKTAIITGASRGIGKETALFFASQGYQLALCCQTKAAALAEVAKECEAYGVQVFHSLCDVSNPVSVEAFINDALLFLGSCDVLVNNAGRAHIGLLTDLSVDEWENIINTNLNSVFYTCRLIIPEMVRKQSGRIVNISSVWGNVGASCEVAYSATKGGINSFTKALAKELAPSNIQVNAAAFGYIDTEMNQELTKEDKAALSDEIPVGRPGTAKEAANLVYQIVTSPAYLTGQVITMDGGWC